jgi:hypothetical protein
VIERKTAAVIGYPRQLFQRYMTVRVVLPARFPFFIDVVLTRREKVESRQVNLTIKIRYRAKTSKSRGRNMIIQLLEYRHEIVFFGDIRVTKPEMFPVLVDITKIHPDFPAVVPVPRGVEQSGIRTLTHQQTDLVSPQVFDGFPDTTPEKTVVDVCSVPGLIE